MCVCVFGCISLCMCGVVGGGVHVYSCICVCVLDEVCASLGLSKHPRLVQDGPP